MLSTIGFDGSAGPGRQDRDIPRYNEQGVREQEQGGTSMRARQMIAVVVAVGGIGLWLAGTTAPVEAHHAFAAEFDADRPVNFSGTVTKVEWVNPHVWIHMDVNLDNGSTEPWAFEAGTPNVLFRRGFTRESLLPGTEVRVDGYQAKDGTNRANGSRHHTRRRNQAVSGFIGHRRTVRAGSTWCRYRGSRSVSGRAESVRPPVLRCSSLVYGCVRRLSWSV